MKHAATEGRPQPPENLFSRDNGPWLPESEYLLRENCRIARNRGFLAGVVVMAFVVATVLFVLELLQ